MDKLVKTNNGYEIQQVSGFSAVVDCLKAPIKPIIGEASTAGDGRIAAGVWFLVGAGVGGTIGYKYVKKAQGAYHALRNSGESHLASASDISNDMNGVMEDEYSEEFGA